MLQLNSSFFFDAVYTTTKDAFFSKIAIQIGFDLRVCVIVSRIKKYARISEIQPVTVF